jgi:2'-5' RNA ligase
MIETGSYAVWLMPSGQLYDRLARVIFELSRKYGTPAFEPHVTLLAHIPGTEDTVASRCEQLANRIEPYVVRLTRLDRLNEYYRCLFVRVLETPAVVEANSEACQVFEVQKAQPYMPHLSLLYGDFSEVTKNEIVEGLRESWDLEFSVDRFHLIDGRGGPTDWRRVKEFALRRAKPTSGRLV